MISLLEGLDYEDRFSRDNGAQFLLKVPQNCDFFISKLILRKSLLLLDTHFQLMIWELQKSRIVNGYLILF